MDLISIASIMVIVYISLSLLLKTTLVVAYIYFMYRMFAGDSAVSSSKDWMSDEDSAFPFGNE
tara:strand:- start:6709 stop:6897 length:189 start_codon:yes stop_codon:yes gene_type:complete